MEKREKKEKRESSFPTFMIIAHSLSLCLCVSVSLSLCVCLSLCGANNIICLLCL